MRITNINIPEERVKDIGLRKIQMRKLGQVVLLAGKNGSGKTRMLAAIESIVGEASNSNTINEIRDTIGALNVSLVSGKSSISSNEKALENVVDSFQRTEIERQISQMRRNIDLWDKSILEYEEKLRISEWITFDPAKTNEKIFQFVPRAVELQDSYTLTKEANVRNAELIKNSNVKDLAKGTIPAITQIISRWVNVNSIEGSDLALSEAEKQKINNDYLRLKDYIKQFLGTDLQRNADQEPVLFGKRIGEAKLSDGQRVLLQFCVSLYAKESDLSEMLIFMDEPENHLHPGALLYVLDKIIDAIPNGQLWIATHSVNVLAHFDPSCIHYVKDGSVSYSGNQPSNVLAGLMGKDEEIAKLHHFLSLPMAYAMEKFAYECLTIPDVVFSQKNDPQLEQIRKELSGLITGATTRKILDFGIGKGRVIASLLAEDIEANIETSKWLDYVAYDITDDKRTFWEPTIRSIYGSCEKRFYMDYESIQNDHGQQFDIVIMCNVLHEIEPEYWKSMFNSLYSLLKPTGYLLIMEDQYMPVGELANHLGFLLLGAEQVRILFKIEDQDALYGATSYKKENRLMAYRIPRTCLSRVDDCSIKSAIESLNTYSLRQIELIRKKETRNYKDGQHHALWTQLYANSALALNQSSLVSSS